MTYPLVTVNQSKYLRQILQYIHKVNGKLKKLTNLDIYSLEGRANPWSVRWGLKLIFFTWYIFGKEAANSERLQTATALRVLVQSVTGCPREGWSQKGWISSPLKKKNIFDFCMIYTSICKSDPDWFKGRGYN